jgi:hypothetical protein
VIVVVEAGTFEEPGKTALGATVTVVVTAEAVTPTFGTAASTVAIPPITIINTPTRISALFKNMFFMFLFLS